MRAVAQPLPASLFLRCCVVRSAVTILPMTVVLPSTADDVQTCLMVPMRLVSEMARPNRADTKKPSEVVSVVSATLPSWPIGAETLGNRTVPSVADTVTLRPFCVIERR
jgi:hypothetical protein